MKLSEQQKFILFALGKCYQKCNQDLNERILQASISKSAFIEIVNKAGLAKKKERALYKNLESLGEARFISYENKNLALTKKGKKAFDRLNKDLQPYTNLIQIIQSEDLLKLTKKARVGFQLSKS